MRVAELLFCRLCFISCVIVASCINAAPANVSDELLQTERTERLRLQNEVNTLADKLSEFDRRMQMDSGKYSFIYVVWQSHDHTDRQTDWLTDSHT